MLAHGFLLILSLVLSILSSSVLPSDSGEKQCTSSSSLDAVHNTKPQPQNDHLLRHAVAAEAEMRRNSGRSRGLFEEYRQRTSASYFLADFEPIVELVGKPRRVCFIHSCSLVPGDNEILSEILNYTIAQELMAQLDRVYLLNYGHHISEQVKASYSAVHQNIRWLEMGPDASLFEIPTIAALHSFVKAIDDVSAAKSEETGKEESEGADDMQILYVS